MIEYDKDILERIGLKLIERKETLAVAESVTAGAVQLSISTIPDARKFFQGGLTAYNAAQKYHHLKVEPIHAAEVNCISEKVAKEMALEVVQYFRSNWGVAITGYSAPSPESGNKVFAYYAVCHHAEIVDYGLLEPHVPDGFAVQIYYANELNAKLLSALHDAKSDNYAEA